MTNSSSLLRAECVVGALCAVLTAGVVLHLTLAANLRDAAVMFFLSLASLFAFVELRRARRSITEVSKVMRAAAQGDMESRVVLLDDGGIVADLARDANRLLDVADAFVREAQATLGCVRDGKHHRRVIERGMVGSFGRAAVTMNAAVEAIDARVDGFERVMHDFEGTVGGVAHSLGEAVARLSSSAGAMRDAAGETERRTTTIGESVEETSSTVATVAAATEELNAAVADISRQTALALSISRRAGQRAQESRETIVALSRAVDDILGVVDLITSVAEQTKLLALNATIEAARAGPAGRGFGVVATEVKALAGQTASATETIVARIRVVSDRAERCMSTIEGIADIVAEIGAAASAISSAVGEQTHATEEISRSMQSAAAATDEVSANVVTVAEAAGATERVAGEVAGASETLADQTERLRMSVGGFLDQARRVVGARHAA